MPRWRTIPTDTSLVEVLLRTEATEGWISLGFVPKDQALQLVQEFVKELHAWGQSQELFT